MQIWPAQTGNIAVLVRAVVSQQQDCVFEDLILLVLDAQVAVDLDEFVFLEILKSFVGRIGEDDERRVGLLNVSTYAYEESDDLLCSEHKLWSCTAPST